MSDSDEIPEPDPGDTPEIMQNDLEVLNFCIEAGWHIEKDDQGLVRLLGDFTGTPLEGLQVVLARIAGFIPRLGFTDEELAKLANSVEWVLKTCAFFEILDSEPDEFESIVETFEEMQADAESFFDTDPPEDDPSEDWWKKGEKPPFYDT